MPIANASPTLSGITYAVGGVTPLANSRVVAVNFATREAYTTDDSISAANGTWSLVLPQGTYAIIAQTPHQDIVNTDSDLLSAVTVDANGVATLSGSAATGRTTTTFNLTLKTPRWTGTIRNPAGALMEGGDICITDEAQSYRSCSYSDSLGRWALGAPSNVTSYSDDAWVSYGTNPELPTQLPERRFNNKAEIIAVGAMGAFPGSGVTTTGIALQLQVANFTVVIKAGGVVVENANAYLMQEGAFIGFAYTDQNGSASWYTEHLTKASTVNVQLWSTTVSQSYAATEKTFTSAEVIANAAAHSAIFTVDIALDSANLFGVLRQPTVAGTPGAVVADGNIELRLAGNNGVPSFANTNSSGAFSLYIPKPTTGADLTYTMTVHPLWNSLLSSSKTVYDVSVSTANLVTVTLRGATITATNTAIAPYALALSAPSVSGTVVSSNGTTPVADSYVIPINHSTGVWLGEYGDHSKSDGTFGISLVDGTYDMQAQKPWNSSNLAKSALCAITVAGGVVTTAPAAGTCVPTTNTLKLALRAPNLTMTLKDSASPSAAVAFANVHLQVGNWSTNETSGSDGTVGLYIDRAAILAQNGGTMANDTKINVYVDPPWGNSSMVGWRCQSGDNKEICKSTGGIGTFNVNDTTGQTFTLGNVVFAAPNTSILIKTPNVSPPAGATWTQNTSVGAGAWVWLNVSGNNAANAIGWIGASSDANGYVRFDIADAVKADGTTRFRVEIYPPWNGAVGLSQKTYDSQLLDTIEAGLALNSPNTFITVNVPAATPTIWGWIGIEEVNATTNAFVAWQGGYGLSQVGKVALTLSASKRYKITAYPNKTGAGLGTVTSCYINTDASTVVTKATADAGVTDLCTAVASIGANNTFTLTLSAGNVTGTVTSAAGVVVNATVYATSGTQVVSTTTSTTGTFALNLDNTLAWVIKILPFNATGATALVAVTTLATLNIGFGATALTPTVANQ